LEYWVIHLEKRSWYSFSLKNGGRGEGEPEESESVNSII